MSNGAAAKRVRVQAPDMSPRASEPEKLPDRERENDRHPVFRAIWYTGNILLILAILFAAYSVVWEYSTRRYLKGFSDAIIPESSSAEEKLESILNWMANGPERLRTGPYVSLPDRDPTDTLNYASLLQVCGSATNAFINLANSESLPARRLLLLDSRRMTSHVVAEVLVGGRWIVVDPAFRTIMRGTDGRALTREELANPGVLASATRGIRGYDPNYTFDHTVHIRLARLRFVGLPLREVLDTLLPGWEDSVALSLILERRSLAALTVGLVLVVLLSVLRFALRWYGEKRLGERPVRIGQQFMRALEAFLDTEG